MDDDGFKRRLDEINREMHDLLSSPAPLLDTASTAADVVPLAEGAGRAVGAFEAATASASPHAAGLSSGKRFSDPVASLMNASNSHNHVLSSGGGYFGTDALRREVQNAVSHEMRRFEDRVREIVSKEWDLRARELDAVLKNRFQELRVANEHIAASVISLAEASQSQATEFTDRLKHLEQEVRRRLLEVDREVKAQARETQSTRDVCEELQQSVRSDSRDVDKRVEEAMHRHSEAVRGLSARLEERIAAAQRGLETQHRDTQRALDAEIDRVARAVSQVQGALESSTHVLDRVVHDVRHVTDCVSSHESAMRKLRSDVHQTEIACMTLSSTASQKQPSVPGVGPSRDVPLADWAKLQQDVYALKECVAYLHDLVVTDGGGGSAPNHHHHHAHHQAAHHRDARSSASPFAGSAAHGNLLPVPLDVNLMAMASGGATTKPPYIASSTRSTPTKASQRITSLAAATAGGGVLDSPGARGAAAARAAGGGDISSRWSDGGGNASGNPSPTYRTVPDSDSEEERENSKLARSELD